MVKYVNAAGLEELIANEKLPVFCDFWASWCGPCRMLAPVFEELSEKYENQAVFVKMDIDENESSAVKYGITSIPNIIAFQGGKVKDNNLGFVPMAMLESFVQKNI